MEKYIDLEKSTVVAERVRDIRRRIALAKREGTPDAVTLVAASKTMPYELIRQAVEAGVDAVGENRVQELLEKDAQNAYDGVPLHFIGRLQKNKVSKLVGRVALIHSVDSPALAQAIDTCAERLGVVQPVLVQVNIAAEQTKGGLASEEVQSALEIMSSLQHIHVRGLMCIPPPIQSDSDTQYFVDIEQLYLDIRGKNMDNIDMDFLSMGMSGDFELAVRAGANMLRIGSALFGQRG